MAKINRRVESLLLILSTILMSIIHNTDADSRLRIIPRRFHTPIPVPLLDPPLYPDVPYPIPRPFTSGDKLSTKAPTSQVLSLLDSLDPEHRSAPKCWHDPGFDWRDPKLWDFIPSLTSDQYETFWEFCTKAGGNSKFYMGCECSHQSQASRYRSEINSVMECSPGPAYTTLRLTPGLDTLWSMCLIGCGCKLSQKPMHPLKAIRKKEPRKLVDATRLSIPEPADIRQIARGYDSRFCSSLVSKGSFMVALCPSKWLVIKTWLEAGPDGSKMQFGVREFPLKMQSEEPAGSYSHFPKNTCPIENPGSKGQCGWNPDLSIYDVERLLERQSMKTRRMARQDRLGVLLTSNCDFAAHECVDLAEGIAGYSLSVCRGTSAYEKINCLIWVSAITMIMLITYGPAHDEPMFPNHFRTGLLNG